VARLRAHDWPGNVRELENIIARGVLLSADQVVQAEDLFLESGWTMAAIHPASPAPIADIEPDGDEDEAGPWPLENIPDDLMTIRDMERGLISKALRRTDGNRTHAAKILGISVRTLRNKLAEYKNLGFEAVGMTA
jgi:two-component system response regulator FlrC